MGRVNAGQLQERITLCMPGVIIPDGQGGDTEGPETRVPLWARVRPLGGREKVANGQTLDAESYEVTIRRRQAVSAKQHIEWEEKRLNVLAVVPDEDKEYLKLTCAYGGQ